MLSAAELSILKAARIAAFHEKVAKATSNLRRQIHDLLIKSDELISSAESMQLSLEERSKIAFEKASQAEDLLMEIIDEGQQEAMPNALLEISQEGGKTRLEPSEKAQNVAIELFLEGMKHGKKAENLEHEAMERIKIINKALEDSKKYREKQKMALEAVEGLVKEVNNITDESLQKQWESLHIR